MLRRDAQDLQPRLEAVAQKYRPGVDTDRLARYAVAVLEGSIILARANQDAEVIADHFALLKQHLQTIFGVPIYAQSHGEHREYQ